MIFLISSSPLIAEKSEKASGELRVKLFAKNFPLAGLVNVEVDPSACGAKHKVENIKADSAGRLQNAVIWLEPQSGPMPPPLGETAAELNIHECEFSPQVVFSSPDQSIKIRSSDPILFQIRARGQRNSRQGKPLPPNLKEIQLRFKEPEIIPISCDLHSWMKAFVVIAPHRLYGITDDQGQVRLNKIQPGEYVLYLWHEIFGQKKWPEQLRIKSGLLDLKIDWDYLETDTPVEK